MTYSPNDYRKALEDMTNAAGSIRNAAHIPNMISTNKLPYIQSEITRINMISMRLSVEGPPQVFAHLTTALATDKVYVFVMATENTPPVILEDERGLFPSDKLITQLRMLAK